MTAEPDRFAQIIKALQEVVPTVERIRAHPVAVTRTEQRTVTIEKQTHSFDQRSTVMGQELIFDMKSGAGLPASAISEGTLLALAVLTFVHGDDEADLIMIDDVDDGLHPKAQRDLIGQLRRIQETHPKLQIIVSTHSPYVVDEFKAEDVWVFAPDKEGCAVTKRLSEHPDATRALEVLTTGEFWSAEGEPWVLNPEPAARVAEEPGA
jgi:predicted ATP-binding protein involved in virulence